MPLDVLSFRPGIFQEGVDSRHPHHRAREGGKLPANPVAYRRCNKQRGLPMTKKKTTKKTTKKKAARKAYNLKKAGKLVVDRFDEAVARCDSENDDIVILHGLEKAMVGTSERDGHVVAVYERELCIRCIMDSMDDKDVIALHKDEYSESDIKENPELVEQMKYQDAEEFFDYNTIGSLKSMGVGEPVIVDSFDMDSDRWQGFIEETKKSKKADEKVTVTCYGKTKTYPNRQAALKFYKDCYHHSEGCERERYVKIFMQLLDGKKSASDEIDY